MRSLQLFLIILFLLDDNLLLSAQAHTREETQFLAPGNFTRRIGKKNKTKTRRGDASKLGVSTHGLIDPKFQAIIDHLQRQRDQDRKYSQFAVWLIQKNLLLINGATMFHYILIKWVVRLSPELEQLFNHSQDSMLQFSNLHGVDFSYAWLLYGSAHWWLFLKKYFQAKKDPSIRVEDKLNHFFMAKTMLSYVLVLPFIFLTAFELWQWDLPDLIMEWFAFIMYYTLASMLMDYEERNVFYENNPTVTLLELKTYLYVHRST